MRTLLVVAGALAMVPLGMAPIAGAAAQETGKITTTENALLAAGFEARPADNAVRQAMLARLPAKKFSTRTRGDMVMYVYPDPKNCNCLYVGTQDAYGRYRQTEETQNIAADQRMAADEYADARWNWGAWGPWGPGWDGFGFGPRIGW